NGEGRTDNVSAYMDGFAVWKNFQEHGIQGVIRGDEGFGWTYCNSSFSVRWTIGLKLCSDIENLKCVDGFGFPKQIIPEHLQQRSGEEIADWRDRLYHEYRLPIFLAALSDLKLSYVEVCNPLLFKGIIDQV